MNYNDIKKLDEKTLEKLTEGLGPSDECLCHLLAPPDGGGGFGSSLKKVFAWPGRKKASGKGQREVEIPLNFNGRNGTNVSKEVVKRNSSCGKCGCDKEDVVLKHTYANIRITSPDISSVCPCPTDCFPDRAKLQDIQVTIEHMTIEPYTQRTISLPNIQNVSQLPDSISQLPDGVGQVPDIVGQVPDIVGQVPNIVGQLPDIVGQVPDIVGQVPDGVGQPPDIVGQVPDIVGQVPDGINRATDRGSFDVSEVYVNKMPE